MPIAHKIVGLSFRCPLSGYYYKGRQAGGAPSLFLESVGGGVMLRRRQCRQARTVIKGWPNQNSRNNMNATRTELRVGNPQPGRDTMVGGERQ